MRPLTLLAVRLLPVVGVCAVLAGCGSPPQPLPTAPPEAPGSGSAQPSASGPGAFPVPTPTGGGFPTLPPANLPTYPPITYPPITYPPVTYPPITPTTPATPRPSPAPKCTNGPTKAQVLAVIKDEPGMPAGKDLVVYTGPFCSGTWQFTTVEIAGKDPDDLDPLFVVTTGTPAALTLVEAGTDVCSSRVQNEAPKGIRVRACGF